MGFAEALPIGVEIISLIKNGIEAIKAWTEFRDRRAASKLLQELSLKQTQSLPEVISEGKQLTLVVPLGI